MHVGGLILVAWGADTVKTGLTISFELIVLGQVLRSVLVELEKACGIVIYIGIPEVVQLVAQCLLDELSKLWGIFLLMDIEFASGILELVSGGCLGALSNYFVNTTLNIGTF